MAVIGELATLVTARTAPFERGMQRVRKETKKTNKSFSLLRGSVFKLTAALGGTAAAVGIVKASLQLAINAERAQIAFANLLQDVEAATGLLRDIRGFAAITPFQVPELTDASRKLLAFGTSANEVIPTLRVLGDIASGTGNSIGEIAEIYGKAQVQQRLFAEDINQLTGRGIPVITALAKQFGVADSKLKELVKEGDVGFSNLRNALIDLTAEGSRFGGMMEAQSKTLGGSLSTLRDAVSDLGLQFGQTLAKATALTEKVQMLTELVKDLNPKSDKARANQTVVDLDRLEAIRRATISDIESRARLAKIRAFFTTSGGFFGPGIEARQNMVDLAAESQKANVNRRFGEQARELVKPLFSNLGKASAESVKPLEKIAKSADAVSLAPAPFVGKLQDFAGMIGRGAATASEGVGMLADSLLSGVGGLSRLIEEREHEVLPVRFAGAAQRGSASASQILQAARLGNQEQRLQEREVKLTEEGNRLLSDIADAIGGSAPVRLVGSLLDGGATG